MGNFLYEPSLKKKMGCTGSKFWKLLQEDEVVPFLSRTPEITEKGGVVFLEGVASSKEVEYGGVLHAGASRHD